jgi:hypothetical protein
MKATSLCTGLLAGAGLAYLLDPDSGRRRRALARDRVEHWRHELRDAAQAATKVAANRAWGGAAALGRRALPEPAPSDDVLEARVRSAIGTAVSHPRAITVEVRDGAVRLGGPVFAHEVVALRERVREVRGVSRLDDALEIHETAQGVPALQGGGRLVGAARPAPARQAAIVAGSAAVVVLFGGRMILRVAAALAPQVAAAGLAAVAVAVARQESHARRNRAREG